MESGLSIDTPKVACYFRQSLRSQLSRHLVRTPCALSMSGTLFMVQEEEVNWSVPFSRVPRSDEWDIGYACRFPRRELFVLLCCIQRLQDRSEDLRHVHLLGHRCLQSITGIKLYQCIFIDKCSDKGLAVLVQRIPAHCLLWFYIYWIRKILAL